MWQFHPVYINYTCYEYRQHSMYESLIVVRSTKQVQLGI